MEDSVNCLLLGGVITGGTITGRTQCGFIIQFSSGAEIEVFPDEIEFD